MSLEVGPIEESNEFVAHYYIMWEFLVVPTQFEWDLMCGLFWLGCIFLWVDPIKERHELVRLLLNYVKSF